MSLATMVAGGILFIIALDEGNISAGDMVLGSDNKYVVSVPSTEEGKFRYSRLLCYDYGCW